MGNKLVSVIMPCLNEADHLRTTIDSVMAQTIPPDQIELLVVDGGSSDDSREIVRDYQGTDVEVFLLHNPKRHIAAALNIGLDAARGDFIVRMDAHTVYAPDYVSRCIERLDAGQAEAVGGRQQGKGYGLWGQTIAMATQHPFGSGGPAYKVARSPEYVDTVYLGAWRQETLRALGGWSESWEINEDYELFHRLRAQGGRVLVDPAIESWYAVRSSLKRLARQYYSYGQWKVKTLVEHPSSAAARHFANPILVAGFALGSFLVPWTPWLLATQVVTYSVAIVLAASHAALRARATLSPLGLLLVFPLIHFSWGLGFLRGTMRFGWPVRAAWHVCHGLTHRPARLSRPSRRCREEDVSVSGDGAE